MVQKALNGPLKSRFYLVFFLTNFRLTEQECSCCCMWTRMRQCMLVKLTVQTWRKNLSSSIEFQNDFLRLLNMKPYRKKMNGVRFKVVQGSVSRTEMQKPVNSWFSLKKSIRVKFMASLEPDSRRISRSFFESTHKQESELSRAVADLQTGADAM